MKIELIRPNYSEQGSSNKLSLPAALVDRIVRLATSDTLREQITFKEVTSSNRELAKLSNRLIDSEDDRAVNRSVKIYSGRLRGGDTSIVKVDLTNSTLLAIDLVVIIDAFIEHPHSKSLSLANCKLSDGALAQVIDRLSQKSGLIELDLSANSMASRAIDSLAMMLNSNSTLESLNLGYNFLGDIGFERLFNSLVNHPNLKQVQLNYCGLSKKSEKLFKDWHDSNKAVCEKVFAFS